MRRSFAQRTRTAAPISIKFTLFQFKMDYRALSIILTLTLSCCTCLSVRPPCRANRAEADSRTLGLLFGQWGQPWRPGGWAQDCAPSDSGPTNKPGEDYVDPVYSEEESDYSDNNRPPDSPLSAQGSNNFASLLNWLPQGVITPDKWPQKPHRPPKPQRPQLQPGWFMGWLNQANNRPPVRPTRPPWNNRPTPSGDNNIKPVYEHIDEEEQNESWKPGGVVGGPSNSIIPVTQDLSSWTRPPTPRPTRPPIPGYSDDSRNKNPGFFESVVDLIFKSR